MKYLNTFFLLVLILFNYSCGTIKEGFTNQKKNSSDEFLVEKKSPLVMPPDYNELPIPDGNILKTQTEKNKIKELVKINKSENNSDIQTSQSFEDSLLEKIKNN